MLEQKKETAVDCGNSRKPADLNTEAEGLLESEVVSSRNSLGQLLEGRLDLRLENLLSLENDRSDVLGTATLQKNSSV